MSINEFKLKLGEIMDYINKIEEIKTSIKEEMIANGHAHCTKDIDCDIYEWYPSPFPSDSDCELTVDEMVKTYGDMVAK